MRPVIAVLGNVLPGDGGEFSTRDVAGRAFTEALLAAGSAPFVLPCLEDDEAVGTLLAEADGLLITGGGDVSPDLYGQSPPPIWARSRPHATYWTRRPSAMPWPVPTCPSWRSAEVSSRWRSSPAGH